MPKTLDTTAIHAGEDGPFWQRSLTLPIAQTSTYTFARTDDLAAYKRGDLDSMEYGRYGNPTIAVVEAKLAALEGAEAALLVSSGMAAEALLFLALLGKDGHAVVTSDHYPGTKSLLDVVFPKFGISYTIVPVHDSAALAAAIRPNTSVLFTELPTNPHLHIPDLSAMAELAKRHRITFIVDATLATPVLSRPLTFGADLVLHSATKYMGGHNDLLAGVIAGPKAMIDVIREHNAVIGAVLSPHDAYLLNRGLKTLPLRVERQSQNAAELCARLAEHPAIAAVYYPSHNAADKALATRYMPAGCGGLLSFRPKGGAAAACQVLDRLQLISHAASLGGVESMAQVTSLYVTDPHAPVTPNPTIEPDLIRLSVGLEHLDDLWRDLDNALTAQG